MGWALLYIIGTFDASHGYGEEKQKLMTFATETECRHMVDDLHKLNKDAKAYCVPE